MKKIKVRFKANICGYKKDESAEVTEDFLRRAGNDVEVISERDDQPKEAKTLKVSNKAMNKKQIKVK